MSENNLPVTLEPATDFHGHLVSIQKTWGRDIVFCSKFYTVNGFLCLKDVKREEKVISDEKKTAKLFYEFGTSCGNCFFKVYPTYDSTICVSYYSMVPMRTVPSRYLDDSTSFSTEEETPLWTQRDEQKARAEADMATRKNNEEIRLQNRKFLFSQVIPDYRIHIAQKAYFKSWWRRIIYENNKKNGEFDQWVTTYCEKNDIDLIPLKRMIEKMKIEFDQEIDWMIPERKVTESED